MIALLKDILPIIENTAPILASALGSPMSGVIIKLICDAFGESTHDIPALINTVQNREDAPAIFKSIELTNAPWINGLLKFQAPSKIILSVTLDWT